MAVARPTILGMAELGAMVADDTAEAGTHLVVDLSPGTGLPQVETARTIGWLRSRSAVVIGVRTDLRASHRLDNGADLIVTPDELDRCAHAIEANPEAARVLMEVLRTTEHLPAADALVVESLAYATLQAGTEHRAWLEGERRRRSARELPGRPDVVLLDRRDGILHVRLNSPETRNSLSVPMRDALTDAFALVAMDPTIEQVEVRGNGPCFSAGGDLKEFGLVPDPATAHRIRMERMPARRLLACAERYRFHLHGACIGAGIELPAFARQVLAAPDTRLRLPEVGMGLIPGAGGCVSIPRRIGRHRTAHMALTGEDVSADQALAWGLVDAIEAPEESPRS